MYSLLKQILPIPYGTKLWRIGANANKHFGGQNIGGLTALHYKIAIG